MPRSSLARHHALAHKNAGKTVGVYCFENSAFFPKFFPNFKKSGQSEYKNMHGFGVLCVKIVHKWLG